MTGDNRLLACAVISFVGHFAVERWLQRLPPNPDATGARKVEIRVIMPTPTAPEPEPEPAKSAEPPPPQPPQRQIHERTRRPVVAQKQAEAPRDTPPPDQTPLTNDTSTTPVFGVSMESTSQAGNGPAMPVGNTVRPRAGAGPAADEEARKPLAEPLAAYQVTKMPLPQGDCMGKYNEEALGAAVEGTVVLDLVVDAKGRARDITVVEGLPHGLDKAAIAALKECRFTPGEQDGHTVPVRVRGFKIRFVLPDGH